MDEQTKFILRIVAVPLLLALGAWFRDLILKRTKSAEKEQDDEASIRKELWQENRQDRSEIEKWQDKFYQVFVSLNRIESVMADHMKLQVKYQDSLLERAKLEAEIESLKGLVSVPLEGKDC